MIFIESVCLRTGHTRQLKARPECNTLHAADGKHCLCEFRFELIKDRLAETGGNIPHRTLHNSPSGIALLLNRSELTANFRRKIIGYGNRAAGNTCNFYC